MHQLKDAIPVSDDFTLLYADASLLVANKPSRLLSVPGRGEEKSSKLVMRSFAGNCSGFIAKFLARVTRCDSSK